MLRQYYASPWIGGDNPLRVGPIALGAIFRLPSSRDLFKTTPWIVEGFRNGVCAATKFNPRTGRWEDRYLRGRSDSAMLRCLADGARRDVAVRMLLRLQDDGSGEHHYSTLPDVARFHGGRRPRQTAA